MIVVLLPSGVLFRVSPLRLPIAARWSREPRRSPSLAGYFHTEGLFLLGDEAGAVQLSLRPVLECGPIALERVPACGTCAPLCRWWRELCEFSLAPSQPLWADNLAVWAAPIRVTSHSHSGVCSQEQPRRMR